MLFCFMLEALFVLEIFIFLSWHFDHGEKRLDKKGTVNFKDYDIIILTTYIYYTDITQYIKK